VLGSPSRTGCGEYYHVAHNLTRVTNFGIAFGGVLRLIKVEPSKAVQGIKLGDSVVSTCG
jgi:hypothetical protein